MSSMDEMEWGSPPPLDSTSSPTFDLVPSTSRRDDGDSGDGGEVEVERG